MFDRPADIHGAVVPSVPESELHRSMKGVMRTELESEGYFVFEEPLFPPTRRLSWSGYRPDLLGFRRDGCGEEVVIVECETRPNMKRFTSKNHTSVSFQASIISEGRVRRILAIPRGRLHAVDLRIRAGWEVWILGAARPFEKLMRLEGKRLPSEIVPPSEAAATPVRPVMENHLPPIRAGTSRR